ncbi:murein biosynthesis integral membrane protein MurJ [Thermopolyspora sp. NPDC052614]|uniref:murein biosynthesis integral membrane protein MurJ n=1 Tax=Thermopolyspora sp. NPDC052614 TaxID=3155682 RepID=UPI003427C5F7
MNRLLRAGAIMAAGTMVSRLTGFIRTAVIAAAIGTALLGDAYNVAYQIPYILFDLLIGGMLSSVIVPSIVRAQKHDADGGKAYEQRLLTIATVLLIGVAALGVLLAEPIIELYTSDLSPRGVEVAATLARYILPQIAFFGLGAIAGAILNTRDRFAAPMWAPVLNNLVVIGVGLAYIFVIHGSDDIDKVSATHLAVLGLGTTAGIVAQSIALVISLHRAGFRFRPRFDLRDSGLGELAKLGAWALAFVGINQLAFVVTTNLTTAAGSRAIAEGVAYGAGWTPYNYAYQLFQLPYGIIAVSVITAMLPRMSRYVTDGRLDLVRDEFSSGVRMVCSVIVPAGVLLMVLGPAVTVLIFSHGANSVQDAVYIGNVLQVFGLALVPFSLFQLLLRVFYSFGDTRTPALVALGNAVLNAALSFVAYLVLPAGQAVMGMAFAFTVTYTVGAGATWMLASRRAGGLGGRSVLDGLWRMYGAALPCAAIALGVLWATRQLVGLGTLGSALMLVVGGGLGMAVYLFLAHRLRIPEVNSIVGLVAGRVGR